VNEDRERKYIEKARDMYDLVNYSKETKRLFQEILAMAEVERARECSMAFEQRTVTNVDGSQRLETPEERCSRFERTCGYVEGVMYVPTALMRLLAVAERSRAEEEEGEQ